MSGTSPDSVSYPVVGYGLVGYTNGGTGFANYLTLDGSVAGSPVIVQARGTDDNISITLAPKGTGTVNFGATTFSTLNVTGATTLGTGSANYLTFTGAAASSYPTITATGSDTNIDVWAVPKGTGYLQAQKLYVGSTSARAGVSANTGIHLRNTTVLSGAGWATTNGSGNVSGSISATVPALVDYAISETVAAGAFGFSVMRVLGTVNTGATGSRGGLIAGLNVDSDITVQSSPTQYHVGMAAINRAKGSYGGAPNGTKGDVFAANFITGIASTTASTGAGTCVNSVVGLEINTYITDRTQSLWNIMLQLVPGGAPTGTIHARRGAHVDVGLGITGNLGITSLRTGIAFGQANGLWSFGADSQLITSLPTNLSGTAYAASDGLAWKDITFGRVAFEFASASLDGNYNFGAQTTAGVALQTRSAITAKTAVVNTITVIDGGCVSATSLATLAVQAPPGSGTTATATVATWGGIYIGSQSGGTGYAVDDILTVVGGTGTAATLRVVKVSAGRPTDVLVETAGSYSVLPSDLASVTGGSGTGYTVTMQYTALTITVTGAGTNYPEFPAPTVKFTGGTIFRKLIAKVTMTATQGQLQLNSGKLNVTGIPTSSAGLSSGDLYSNAGVLTVVP